MKIHLTVTLLLITTLAALGQQISGKIIDSELNEPIPFVTIKLGVNKGTMSNIEGVYRLNLQGLDPDHKVTFSSMGYDQLELSVLDLQTNSTINLQPSIEQLGQVIVSNKELTALDIINKFRQHRDSNHQLGNQRYRLFHRNRLSFEPQQMEFLLKKATNMSNKERKKINKTMKEVDQEISGNKSISFSESLRELYTKDTMIVDIKKKIYLADSLSKNSIEDYEQQTINKLFNNFKSPHGFKVKIGLIKIADSVGISEVDNQITFSTEDDQPTENLDAALTEYPNLAYTSDHSLPDMFKNTDHYTFKLQDPTYINDRPQYVIQFKPDRRKAKFQGIVYIDQEDYAITQLDYSLAQDKSLYKLNLKIIGIKFDAFKATKSIRFAKNKEGFYVPYYTNATTGSYFYLSRTLTFIENNPNKSERIKFKLDFTIEGVNHDTEEWVLLEQENIEDQTIDYSSFKTDIATETIEVYDPNIWKDYPIFEATQEMKQYHQKN